VCPRLSNASGSEDLEIEEPISCGDCTSFHLHPTLPSMLGTTLAGHQVVQMCEPSQERLLAAFGMMESLHHEQLPVDGVVGLIQQRAGHRHPGVGEHCVPARLLVLKPLPYTLAIGRSSRGGHVVGKVAEPLTQRKHPQALPLARPVQQRVELRTQGLTDRRRDRRQFLSAAY
jgi:hypothetical protein